MVKVFSLIVLTILQPLIWFLIYCLLYDLSVRFDAQIGLGIMCVASVIISIAFISTIAGNEYSKLKK